MECCCSVDRRYWRRRAPERFYELVDLCPVGGVFRGLPRRVVQILEQSGQLREELATLLLILEGIGPLDKAMHQLERFFLALLSCRGVHLVEGILLQVDHVEEN